MYLAPACTFWLLLGSLALEYRPMVAEGAFGLMVRCVRCGHVAARHC